MSHTPGPWTWGGCWPKIDKNESMYHNDNWETSLIEKYMDLQLVGGPDGTPIIPVRIDHYDVIWDGPPISVADRQLIKSSPDLLETLCKVRDKCMEYFNHGINEFDEGWGNVYDIVSDAIETATLTGE